YGRIVLQGRQPQDVWGRGLFRELELDNPAGADVRRGGGFTVSTVLELKRGLLRNSAADNFRIGDSARIVRTAEGGLAAAPIFGRDVAVRYVGRGRIFSGPELPQDSLSLRALYVENDSGVVLQASVTVNDSLVLRAPLWTEPDTTRRYVLTYAAERKDPVFLHPDAEVVGTMRRTRLRTDGEPVVFNNPYTYVRTDQGWGSVAHVQVRVVPRTQPWHPQSQRKVWRVLQITAQDAAGATVLQGLNWSVGYGWRHLPADPNRDETRGLPLPALILQRWTRDGWFAAGRPVPPQVDTAAGWAYAYADGVYGGGDFAIGLRDDARNLRLQVAAILEGPYRNGSMVDDLRQRGWLPETPPDIYPYNLDPMRPYIRVSPLPDSVVDWVVVELRTLLTGGARHYRTALLRRDGKIVDLDGRSPVMLPGLESGAYYVAIHHRNHLAIITAEPVEIGPETQHQVLAMTEDPVRILGGAGALRALRSNGRTVWAMIGGDVNGDGRVNAEDFHLLQSWQQVEGYSNADTDLSGIVTTRDFNVSWNNRERISVVVR
ncbi:MAG: dockerin type I repeat-containing protein, partial [Candidatus Kapabacteria bacterium]|nr:dockerin type I repeat-containing protein [Candidatus Kapabacteria bacterium]MDW8226057.1 dockerin type I repeat-containing protein [Bacteroidota bacterium]